MRAALLLGRVFQPEFRTSNVRACDRAHTHTHGNSPPIDSFDSGGGSPQDEIMSPQREMCDVRTVSDDIITRDILRDVRQYRNQFSTSAHQRQPSSSSANNNNIWSGSERNVKGHAGRNHNEGSPSRIHYHTHTHTPPRRPFTFAHSRTRERRESLVWQLIYLLSPYSYLFAHARLAKLWHRRARRTGLRLVVVVVAGSGRWITHSRTHSRRS